MPSVGPGADPGVQAVSLQVTVSHPPGDRLPLLSARPAVASPAAEHHRPMASTKTAWWQTHIGVNNLPKVVMQRCDEQDLNPRPTDRKPKCLTRCTTAPPSQYLSIILKKRNLAQQKWTSTNKSKGTIPKHTINEGCKTRNLKKITPIAEIIFNRALIAS